MAERIDAHHHFWRYDALEFGWIDDSMSAIRRDFLPGDLDPEIARAGIDGVVSVQARQSLEETHFLLKQASLNPFILGVVGWVPLVDTAVETVIADLAENPKLKGVRHVLQGEPDDYMLHPDFDRGIGALREFDLAYDILITARQLPSAIELVDRHPEQAFVLDHVAKPSIRDGLIEPWASDLKRLAEHPNVSCKISGMVTEADFRAWTEDGLLCYFDVALAAFGADRLMFGSDWPVCLVACEYGRWVRLVEMWTASLAESEREAIFGGNAARVYRL